MFVVNNVSHVEFIVCECVCVGDAYDDQSNMCDDVDGGDNNTDQSCTDTRRK